MTARIAELADAVTKELADQAASGAFGVVFAPERSYVPLDAKLLEDGVTRVDVVIAGHQEAALRDRAHVVYAAALDVGIRYKFKQDSQETNGQIANSEVDPLVCLVEQVYEYLAKKTLCEAEWRDASVSSTFIREHLKDWRQFTGVIRVRFDVEAPL